MESCPSVHRIFVCHKWVATHSGEQRSPVYDYVVTNRDGDIHRHRAATPPLDVRYVEGEGIEYVNLVKEASTDERQTRCPASGTFPHHRGSKGDRLIDDDPGAVFCGTCRNLTGLDLDGRVTDHSAINGRKLR